MGTKRKQHSAEFKAQVAMAAFSGRKTLAELASEYGAPPTMISDWKQELIKNAKSLFEHGNKKAADPQAVIDNGPDPVNTFVAVFSNKRVFLTMPRFHQEEHRD